VSPLKRKLTFLIVVAAVAASAAGAFAATQASSSSPRQAFLKDVAHRLHVTPAQLKQAVAGAVADRLSALVAAGRLTKAQASAIEKRMKASGRLAGLGLLRRGGGRQVGPGFGPGWYGYPPGLAVPGAQLPPGAKLPHGAKLPPGLKLPPGAKFPPRAVPFPAFSFGFGFLVPGGRKAAVSYLGLRPGQLMAQLRSGKSLAEIARARGKSVTGLKSAIESGLRARLTRQVAAKHLTKAQAGKIQAALDARIAAVMNIKMGRVAGRFRAYGRRLAHRHWLVRPGAKLARPGASTLPPGLAG
jgi:hypothetical protein